MRALHLVLASGLCAALSCVVYRSSAPPKDAAETTLTAATIDSADAGDPPDPAARTYDAVRARRVDESAAAKDDARRHPKDRPHVPWDKVP
jgi:hypothetical protein